MEEKQPQLIRRERQRAVPPRGQCLRRRAPVAERDPARAVPDLLTDGVRLVQPLEPVGRVHEATSLDELVRRSLAAEPAAVSELWWRTGEQVMTRLRLHVGRRRADRSTSQVLGRILDELPAYDPQDEPFQEWLDDVVDRFARAAAGDRGAGAVTSLTHGLKRLPPLKLGVV